MGLASRKLPFRLDGMLGRGLHLLLARWLASSPLPTRLQLLPRLELSRHIAISIP